MTTSQKKAIVIGASSGIGYALAKTLAREGYEVGLASRRVSLLMDLKKELHTKTYVKQIDVANPNMAVSALNELISEMGPVDLIIINSGIGRENRDLNLAPELETINVNVAGFVAMACTASQYFLKQKKGHIVGVSSIAGIKGSAHAPAYNASKAFMSNYMQGLRQKFFGTPIYVTDIRPGFVDTPMIQNVRTKFWVASPDKAAQQIVSAIYKKKKVAYVTRRWIIGAIIIKLLPERVLNWLYATYR